MGDSGNVYSILLENAKTKDLLGKIRIGGNIILKLILEKQGGLFRIGSSDALLVLCNESLGSVISESFFISWITTYLLFNNHGVSWMVSSIVGWSFSR
jgi:hypothetical protein